jgi:hypothetical protein
MAAAGAVAADTNDNFSEDKLTITQLSKLIPPQSISRETREMSIRDILNEFHPRDKDYKDAGFDNKHINYRKNKCLLFIPKRQRYFIWKNKLQHKLIDSIIKNFPIPSVILSQGEQRGTFEQEDGQQRFITLWRFGQNLFPYRPYPNVTIYYDKIPPGVSNAYTMKDIPALKYRMDDYKIHVIIAKKISGDDVLPEIFERLNSGKNLSDADKFWNQQNTNVVSNALKIGRHPTLVEPLKNIFGIDVVDLESKKNRTTLCSLVGIIIGLSKPFVSESKTKWGDILTTSYAKHCDNLNMDIAPLDEIILGIHTLLDVYKNAHPGDKDLGNNQHSINRAFTRLFGVMIYDWRERTKDGITSNIIQAFKDYWIKILNIIRTDTHHIDHPDHFSQRMYIDKDSSRKNTNIGMYISQRHSELCKVAMTDYCISYE